MINHEHLIYPVHHSINNFKAISTHALTHSVPPVKLTAARWGEAVMVSPKLGPVVGTKLHTPSGMPASWKTLNTK